MADFTTGMTSVGAVDDSIVLAYDQAFIIEQEQHQVMDQFASYKKDIGAKSISLTKYSQLALATTALTDKEDPSSEAMVDSETTYTPAEYGNVVTKTKLATFQSGGKVDLAAARLVGSNAGRTQDKLAVLALEGSSNELFANSAASEAALLGTEVTTTTFLNRIYNKLARESIMPMFPDGTFAAVLHDDQIHDLRNSTGAGSWQDISKYTSQSDEILKNEVGMICGFRIFRNNHVSINADAGASTVDTYHGLYFGANALGKVVSHEVEAKMTGPFDKLARFVNCGWYGCLAYGIVDQDALYIGTSASSVGSN